MSDALPLPISAPLFHLCISSSDGGRETEKSEYVQMAKLLCHLSPRGPWAGTGRA